MMALILSLYLDGLLSIYTNISLFQIIYFKPMFTITALIFIYINYRKNEKKYYKICIITGLFYDLIFTNTFPFNTIMFPTIGLATHIIYKYLDNTLMNELFIFIIMISLYHILTFLILSLINYLSFTLSNLSNNFMSMLITNTFYYLILYIFYKRKKHKRYHLVI